jgi:CheY-like chemotaxis protein
VLIGCRRGDGRLRLDVYDTGLGIPTSKQHAIFKEFHRLDTGAKVARGLGLGLSIVERIARVLDCKVEVSSVVGRGSHFSVAVPLAPALPGGLAQSVAHTVDLGQLSDLVVLCIDNEPKILDGMDSLLGGWGCSVMKAPDLPSATAMTRAAQKNPSGLLVDYHLDDGNGVDAIVALRRVCAYELPAILITADRSASVREAARLQNIQVLYKPIKPAALRALLTQWRLHRVAAE